MGGVIDVGNLGGLIGGYKIVVGTKMWVDVWIENSCREEEVD